MVVFEYIYFIFKITKGKMGNTKYDKDYVYFDNRHPGSNGVYVSMITSDKVEYKKGLIMCLLFEIGWYVVTKIGLIPDVPEKMNW